MDKERKKIVEAMKSEDPEEELKDQGFSIYTLNQRKKEKWKIRYEIYQRISTKSVGG